MTNFFEIDFLEAGNNKSGDAIALRYRELGDDEIYIHVVDGGYTEDGEALGRHIRGHYGDPIYIDHVVLTHPDGDHAAGLRTILEEFSVGVLWMNRPWEHVDDLLERFEYEYTRDGLIQRLKRDFHHTAALEQLANEHDIPIRDAFLGTQIGKFHVLAPSRSRYLDLIVQSEKTPEPEREASIAQRIFERVASIASYVASFWGQEILKGDTEGTSSENEMSIVQYADLGGRKILLTGDAGVGTLEEAYTFAKAIGIPLPGIDNFQVPHHGSRRNLSSEILDKWLGTRLLTKPDAATFSAMISANGNDDDHPRKAVVRALWHRGASVLTTKNKSASYWFNNIPLRDGWSYSTPENYPEDMEE